MTKVTGLRAHRQLYSNAAQLWCGIFMFSLHFHNNFACQKQHILAILIIGLEKNNIEGRYTGEK
jgi:hypothetical protein